MKKILLASVALVASPVAAQSYDSGAAVTPSWVASPTAPLGSAPADSLEPADVSDSGFTESDWITTTDGDTSTSGTYVIASGHEKKVRIICEPGTPKQVDPIVGFGVTPYGHRHQGIGNVNWSASSTFNTLRASPSSTCSGGPLNGVIYWEPEMLKAFSNGLVAGVRPQTVTFYYVNGEQGDTNKATWLRRNFAFIGGMNPSNYNDTAVRAEYAAAGFEYPGGPDTMSGFIGWQCYTDAGGSNIVAVSRVASRTKTGAGIADQYRSRHLKAEDGSDPWGGSCTGSNASPGLMQLTLTAPDCWDRTNLRSPDGRGHVRYSARKGDNSVTDACPDNWAHVPALQTKTEWLHAGFADYGTWYLSSDRMGTATTDCPNAAAACDGTGANTIVSKDPCRAIGLYYCNGATPHFDWMYGWKSAIVDEWQRECLGITVRGVAPTYGPAECGSSQISRYRALKYGVTSPDSAMSGGCTTIVSCSNATPGNTQRYNPIVAGTGANVTVHHTH